MTENTEQKWRENITGLPEQTEALTSLRPLTVVSAGAGTGKTQTLSQRFAFLLANDPECRVDEILVLTFTEKAAREMRDRIRDTVFEWYENSRADLKHFEQAVLRIDDAQISTIHSFAMKVIRESGLVLNIDPSASIVPEPKEELWWQSFSEALSSLSAPFLKGMLDEAWSARVGELLDEADYGAFVSSYSSGALADAAKAASEKLGSFGKTPEDLWKQDDEALIEDIEKERGVFIETWNLWHDFILPEIREALYQNPGRGCFAALKELDSRFAGEGPTEENTREFSRALAYEVFARLPGNARLKTEIETLLQSPLKEWRERTVKRLVMAEYPSEREKRLSSLLNRTCAVGWQCWETLRGREGVLTNNDLIRYAGEVLDKNPDFGARFKHILIDEFQDTDALQDRLLRALWRGGRNTLFVVGDVKQSIYRFRHANLAIFQGYTDMARSCGDGSRLCVTLDKSFRTRDALLGRLNLIFEHIWRDGIEKGSSMRYEPLSGAAAADWWERRNGEAMEPVLEALVSVEKREKKTDADAEKWYRAESIHDVRLRLFKEAGSRIMAAHSSGARIWDKRAKEFRPVMWNDFAVLVPARTLYPVAERAFEEVGIPYILRTSKDYFERGEVADIVNLISLLAEPDNPLYMAGFLASPFSGGEAGARAEAARLRAIAEYKGAARAVMSVMESPGYLRFYEPDERRRVNANIACMADIAAEYEASQGASLVGCADYMRLAVKNGRSREEPEVTDENQDAVNVLTIHSSKGLEYPIVLLFGAENTPAEEKGINSSVRYGVVTKYLPNFMLEEGEKALPTVSGAWYRYGEAAAARSERERFWYVAATRARDKLIICGVQKRDDKNGIVPPPEGSFLGQLLAVNEETNNCCSVSLIEDGAAKHPHGRAEKGKSGGRALELKTVHPARLARLSASAYAMLAWCPAAYRIAYRQGREMQWAVKGAEGGGSEFGTLAHWALSRWNFDVGTIGALLPEKGSEDYAAAQKMVPFGLRSEFKSDRIRAELREMLSRFAATEDGGTLARIAAESPSALLRETPFRVQDGGLLLVGATDVYWDDENGLHLRDWKTTDEEAAPEEYYEAQLLFYAYAIWKYRTSRNIAALPMDAAVEYLRGGGERKIFTLDEKLLAPVGEKIQKAAETALAGNFEKNTERCGLCPWRKSCLKTK